jgi:hypothetical protein
MTDPRCRPDEYQAPDDCDVERQRAGIVLMEAETVGVAVGRPHEHGMACEGAAIRMRNQNHFVIPAAEPQRTNDVYDSCVPTDRLDVDERRDVLWPRRRLDYKVADAKRRREVDRSECPANTGSGGGSRCDESTAMSNDTRQGSWL